MSGLNQDWYVARTDGATVGPLSRLQLAQMHSQHLFPADALAWHVEHSEWLPLARVVAGAGALLHVDGAMSPHTSPTGVPKTKGAAKSSAPAQRAAVPTQGNATASPAPARKKIPLPPRPADDRDRAAKADAAVAAARNHSTTAAAAKVPLAAGGAAMVVGMGRTSK